MPRYEVEFREGVALVDALSPADARKTARSLFGACHGPYKAILVPPGTTTAGIGLTTKVHESDAFWAAKHRKQTRQTTEG